LDWHDLATTCRLRLAGICYSRDLVAVTETTAGLPKLNAPSETAPCLVREVLEEQRIHRALQAHLQVRNIALGERDDVHAGECQSLEESSRVFLITAESIQGFSEDDVASPMESVPH
jgi:hypothetical protein